MSSYYVDPDPLETQEWLESLDGVIREEGNEKADFLLRELTDRARRQGVSTSPGVLSPYVNTIPPEDEVPIPGDSLTARNVAAYVRWNAMAMVARANKGGLGLGGHIATYTSVSALYEVGFNWFFSRSGGGIWCRSGVFFRDTAPLVFMPVRSWKAAWMRNSSITFAGRWAAEDSPRTPTPG